MQAVRLLFQNQCVVVLTCGAEFHHAVLFDHEKTAKANDGNYYFKNSNKKNPWITVPKTRATFNQKRTYYECEEDDFQKILNSNSTGITPIKIMNMFQDELKPSKVVFYELNKQSDPPKWMICDEAYAITIEPC